MNSSPQDFEYDIFVPLSDNEGQAYPKELLQRFKDRLVKKFGGLTDTRHRNEGTWKIGRVVQRDEIVIWRALSQGENQDSFVVALKKEMAEALQQEEILVIRRQVCAL